MISANDVKYYNNALKLLVDNNGTTINAIEVACNGNTELAESIANELEERGFANRISSIYIGFNPKSKAKKFQEVGGFRADLEEINCMINAINVNYYDLILAHIVNSVNSNGRSSDVDIKDLASICDGDIDLAKVIASELKSRDFILEAYCREGLSISLKPNGKASVFYRSGGFKAEYEKQQELTTAEQEKRKFEKETLWQSTKDEKINRFLYRLSKQKYLAIANEEEETERIIDELLRVKLIDLEGSFYVLTEKGIILTESGQTYQEYINSKSIMKTYNLFVDTAHNTFNIFNIDRTDLDIVVDAYNTGKPDFFIGGEKYFIKNLYKIKIFEFNNPAQFDNFISSARTNKKFTGGAFVKPLLMPDVLETGGKEVTRNFINGGFGYLKAEMVTKSQPKYTMDIFISHSSKDVEITEALVNVIRKALHIRSKNIRCTSLDEYKLTTGAVTDEVLREEIFNSKAFIAIITSNSVNSTYVTFELGARWGSKQPLFPLICDTAGMSLLKAPLTGINAMTATNSAQIQKFVEDLAELLGEDLEPSYTYIKEVDALKELILRNKEVG